MHKFMVLFLLALTLFITLTFSLSANESYQFRIHGVRGAIKQNIELHLEQFTQAENSFNPRFKNAIEQEAHVALQALGYYNSDITLTQEPDRAHRINIHVTLNDPIRIETLDIKVTGHAADDADFQQLVNKNAPKVGDVMHQGNYDSFKNSLKSLALRKGYFNADFETAKLEIAPHLKQAYVHLHFNSGERYRFGSVSFEGNAISSTRLQSLVPFDKGDFYVSSELGELNQALSNSGWFSSILVEADTNAIDNFLIPINVTLSQQSRNIIETGIGYSTDIGPRFKANWRKPWLNSDGHSFESQVGLSGPEQSIEASYKLPLDNVATDFYQFQLGFKNRDINDTKSVESNFGVERHWVLPSGWYRIGSLRWLYEDFTQANQDTAISLIMPGISFNRAKASAGAMPSSANRIMLATEFSDTSWGSDASFIRLRGRLGWIGSVGNDHRFVTRLDAGAILMEEVLNLPPSLRFFAGGDNSLRGYSYESIAPRNSEGELIGGRYLATSSLEYQYRVKGNWWLAAFTDYGSAWDDKPDWKQGVGLGVRWASPVGPIRIDFAWGLDEPHKGFKLHLALGPEL